MRYTRDKRQGRNEETRERAGQRREMREAQQLFVNSIERSPITAQKELIQEAWMRTLGLCMGNEDYTEC